MDRSKLLGEEKIGKLLFKFSFPAIIGMTVMASYNVADRIFVGRGVGALALTGITITFPIVIIFMAFGMLVGIGATANISIRLGQQKKDEAESILGTAFLMTIIIGAVLTILGYLFADQILIQFGGTGQALEYGRIYMRIVLVGAVFQQIAFTMNAMIRGEGNPKMAMMTMVVGAGLNIILNPIFIMVLHWGVAGSAWATVISQLTSATWVLSYFISKKSLLRLHLKKIRLHKDVVMTILSIGVSPFMMQIAASLINIIFNYQMSIYGGDLGIAMIGIGNSLLMMILMPIFGINQGMQPIIGFNYGARNYGRVMQTFKLAIYAATTVCLIGFFIIMFFSQSVISIFCNNNTQLIAIGSHGLRYFLMMLPIAGFQIVTSTYFQSVGKPKQAIILSMSRQVLILIPLLLILPRFFLIDGIWMSGPISDFLSTLLAALLLINEVKRLRILRTERLAEL